MLKTRALIPFGIFHNYSKTITILVRYSLARKQFKDTKGKEMSIINYQLQQEKLFPKIADVFAIMFATKSIMAVADTVLEDTKQGKFDKLNEAHVITSSIKAVCTKDGINGMEMLRRAAGGHGYSSYSGIPSLQL